MKRSGILSVLVLVPLVLAGPAGAAGISFVDLVNPVGHVYHVSDSVQIGVYIDTPLPITQFNFHLAAEPELSLTLVQDLPPLGWFPNLHTGGTCDLLDPLGRCIGSHDPTGTGSTFVQQVGILEFDVVAVGSGEATVSALFAFGDAIVDAGGFDVSSTFDLFPATILIVPEPATVGTLGLGLAWLACTRRRGRARRTAQAGAGAVAQK